MSGDLDHLVNQTETTCRNKTSTADLTARIAASSSDLALLESQVAALDSRLRNIEGSDWWLAFAVEGMVRRKEDSTALSARNVVTRASLADSESNTSRIRSRLDNLETGLLSLPGC